MRNGMAGRNLKMICILLFFSHDLPGLFHILFCAQLKVHIYLKRAPTHHRKQVSGGDELPNLVFNILGKDFL